MRLVNADALLGELEKYSDPTAREKNEYLFGMQQRLETCIELVEDAPTVDAVPVRHGRWECGDKYENAVCSVCGYDTGEAYGFGYGTGCYNFCPNCGADMRKDGEHEKAD